MQGKKVLVVGPEFHGYNKSVENAFKNLGFTTLELPFYEGRVENASERFAYHLTKDKEVFFDKKNIKFNIKFKKIYDSFKPDILFIIKGSCLSPQTIEYAKNSINILWMMDSIFRNKYSMAIRKVVDHIFFFEETDVHRLLKEDGLKSYFLPLALDEKVYYPITAKKDIDILFVGMIYENRKKLLEKIVATFPDKNIKIYGQFFSPIRKPLKFLFRNDKHIYTNKNVQPAFLNTLYSRSKLCLNMHHQQSVAGVNQRFFEILGSKSLEVTDYKTFIGDNFTQTDLLWYTTEDEMVTQIKKGLEQYDSLSGVINNGYQKVVAHHTFTKRMEFVLNTIGWK